MVRIENIESKICAIERYLQILRRYQARDFGDFLNDDDLRGALERYLYLAMQAGIDCAEMTCKFKALEKPETMTDAFSFLAQAKIISTDLLQRMIKMVGFRNILSHGYEHINYNIVKDILSQHIEDLVELVEAIKATV